jgi:hypothetical protein
LKAVSKSISLLLDDSTIGYLPALQIGLVPLGTTCGLLALFLIGPGRDRWRLNGKHRLVPGYLSRKDFTEL